MDLADPLSIRQLEVFVALVEQRSFTKAAHHVGLSQSTVSGHIADLERRLGVMLVERDRGGVRMTSAGEALLRPAREVLRAEQTARIAVQQLTGLTSGLLVVGGSTIPASYFLPELFARFHGAHPQIALRLHAGDSGEILERIEAADLEIGVVGVAPDGREFEHFPIGRDRLMLVARHDHPLASVGTVSIQALLAHPLVTREKGSGTRAATEQALAELAGEPVELPSVCEMGSTESMRAAVIAGLGPAFLSELAVASERAAGTLVEVPIEGFSFAREFHLVARKKTLLSPAARAFMDLARGD
ncbi:MAG: selenium metabolism-associated LysR family transcriptional regulator [Planctomycetota bacterium]